MKSASMNTDEKEERKRKRYGKKMGVVFSRQTGAP
jgi:hypothetical protein